MSRCVRGKRGEGCHEGHVRHVREKEGSGCMRKEGAWK